MSIVLFLFLFLDFVSGAGREEKCSHRNSEGEEIGPADLTTTYCDQATTFVPATFTDHKECTQKACSGYSRYCCCGCSYGGCCGWRNGGCNQWNGGCVSWRYWQTTDSNAYYAYGAPKNWKTQTCAAWEENNGTFSSIWSPFPCTNKIWPDGKCQSAGQSQPTNTNWTATYTPKCGICSAGKFSIANPFGITPSTVVVTDPPTYDNCLEWQLFKGYGSSTAAVDATTFTLPSSSDDVALSVNGVYRFDRPTVGSKKISLYIFDPSPKWNGGKTWESNTLLSGPSKVRCRTAQGLAAYSEPLTNSTEYIIGGTDWTLLKNGKIQTKATTKNPMTGHPCTAGLFDDKGEAHVLQEMYTCSSIKMIDGIDKTVPGYSSPVHGKQCKKWRHVSHMQPGVGFIFTSPSPFGLYKANARRNNGHSDPTMTPALYFYDKLGWEPHSSYTYSWNTKVSIFSVLFSMFLINFFLYFCCSIARI